MLVAFSFRAKPGREQELEALLSNADAGRAVAKGLGATRNMLFWRDGRMVRVLEFPAGAPRRTMTDLARDDPRMAEFLGKLAPLIEDGFDPKDLGSLDAFNQRMGLRLLYDVRT
ncbi:MAG TPA: SchA/CurD-like domain-containing protein [Candidatus Thermoplasmatota archaeon]|jgi:hypothetical protein|nr:SchA/CurD-like domain-containing protein [Candidatus Thermoplasmatota archaeon]